MFKLNPVWDHASELMTYVSGQQTAKETAISEITAAHSFLRSYTLQHQAIKTRH